MSGERFLEDVSFGINDYFIKLILDYLWRSRESGWKPHSYCILTEY